MILLENFEDQSNIADIQDDFTEKTMFSFIYQIVVLLFIFFVKSGLY